MLKYISVALLMTAVALVTPGDAEAERRLALVIGNGGYSIGPLDNPTNDAALMAETLRIAGFEVTHHEDLGYRDMQRAVVQFGRDLRGAGEDTVGMVYYAGHAVQAGGENYLIPVDADIQDELDLDIQTLRIETVMRGLDSAGNRLNMVVLDACRNNPFKAISRSTSRGLAKIDAASGTLLAYSTAPGSVAADGSGRNSPYTAALVKAIRTPGLPVEQVFKRVRIDVMERTGQQQVPWESSSLTGDFMFLEPAPVVAAPAPAPAVQDNNAEIQFWTSIAAGNDPNLFRGYLQAYPDGLFAGLAQQRIETLENAQAQTSKRARVAEAKDYWNAVKDSGDAALLGSVIERYGDTVYAELAQVKLESLSARAAAQSAANQSAPVPDNSSELLFWDTIKNSSNQSDYQAYLDQYPNGTFAAVARDRAQNGFTPQTAALPPATGPKRFEGKLIGIRGCYGGGAWCGGNGEFDMVIELDGSDVKVVFKGNANGMTLRGKLNGNRFVASRSVDGLSGSEAFYFVVKFDGDTARVEAKRGGTHVHLGGEARRVVAQ